jgi:hypothetical protein
MTNPENADRNFRRSASFGRAASFGIVVLVSRQNLCLLAVYILSRKMLWSDINCERCLG